MHPVSRGVCKEELAERGDIVPPVTEDRDPPFPIGGAPSPATCISVPPKPLRSHHLPAFGHKLISVIKPVSSEP